MARSLNRVMLLGNIGRDAETAFTASGVGVVRFSIATQRRWKDQGSGEWKEETDWHNVVFWRGDKVGQYLTKGKQVYVDGRLQTRSYEKAGEKKYVTEVIAENLILLGGGTDAQAASASQPPPATAMSDGISNDDIPF